MTSTKAPPVAKFPGDCGLCVNLWDNSNEKGTFFDVTFERSYSDNGQWKTTNKVPGDQIQNLIALLEDADRERRARMNAARKKSTAA